MGPVLQSLNLGAMRGLASALVPQGASAIGFLRQIGGAVGGSLAGSVLGWRLQAQPADRLRALHETLVMPGLITALARVAAWRRVAPPSGR